MNNITKFRILIFSHVGQWLQARGCHLLIGGWLEGSGRCPLATHPAWPTMCAAFDDSEDLMAVTAKLWGITFAEAESFLDGFEDGAVPDEAPLQKFYDLGQDVRETFSSLIQEVSDLQVLEEGEEELQVDASPISLYLGIAI